MTFVTLDKQDPRTESFLRGTFSFSERALLEPSFRDIEMWRGEIPRDQLTFRLIPVEQLVKPWLPYLKSILRIELIPLVLNPLIATLGWLELSGQLVHWGLATIVAVAAICLHIAVFLFNDVSDHVRGLDTISSRRGSRAIQKGWMTAAQCSRLATVSLILGLGLGAIAVMRVNPTWLLFAPLVPLAILGFNHRRFGLKYRGVGDALIFACFGPAMTAGIALVVSNEWSWSVLHLGALWGWLAVTVFHLRNFENLFADRMIRSGTFICRLGFDRAQKFLFLQLLVFACVWASWSAQLHQPWIWAPTSIYVGSVVLYFCRRIARMRSPLSSLRDHLGEHFLVAMLLAPLILIGMSWIDLCLH